MELIKSNQRIELNKSNQGMVLLSWVMIFDRVQYSYEEQEFWMTRLDWVGIRLNQFEIFE